MLGESSSSPDTGSIGGSVSGGSSGSQSSGGTPSGTSLSTSNGSGGGSGGALNRLDSVAQNIFSSDNTALISNSGNLAFSNIDPTQSTIADGGISNSSLIENDIDPQSQAINDSLPITEIPQTAQAINAFNGISTMSWVWISLVLLLLITTVTVMYNRNKRFTRWNNV